MKIKSKMYRRIITGIAAMLIFVSCLALPALAETGQPGKTVRVGWFAMDNFMEGGFDGSLQSGLTYEFLCEISAYNHWNIEYVPGEFSDLYELLEAGVIDVLPNVIATEERREKVLFHDYSLNEEKYYISALRTDAGKDVFDASDLNGKRLAVTKNAYEEKFFDAWALKNGVSMEKVVCAGFDDAWQAVRDGSADYILNINNAAPDASFTALCRVGEQSVYFAVAKGREDILGDIDYALEMIDDISPFLISDLQQKYLNEALSSYQLSKEEQAWVDSHDVLRIGGLKNDIPYAYEDKNGAVQGAYVELTELILGRLSVNTVRVEWALYPSVNALHEALQNRELDLICPEYHSYSEAGRNGLTISETVMNIPMGILTLESTASAGVHTLATGGTRPGLTYVKETFPGTEVLTCDSVDALVKAVENGEADAAVAHIYALQESIENSRTNFRLLPLSEPCTISYASLEEDHELVMLMNRGYHLISQAEKNTMELRYAAVEKSSLETVIDFLHANMLILILLVLFIAAVIVYAVNRSVSSQKLKKSLDEITWKNELIENYADELQNNADQLSNYKRAILSDALISLEVNLSRDELFYGVWKDDSGNELSLKEILGLEMPCSYDDYVKLWNEKFVKKGYSSDFSGKTDREHLLETFSGGLTEVTFDYEAKTVSGRTTWLRRSICMTQNKSGDVIGFTSVKDISVLVEQMKREEAYIRAMALEYDGIAVVGIENGQYTGDVTLQRKTVSELSAMLDNSTKNAVDFGEKIGRISEHVHPEDRERFRSETRKENIFRALEANKTHTVHFRFLTGTGESLYYQTSFIPLRDDEEKLTGMIVCEKIIDDEMRKEFSIREELETAKIAAEAANRAKSDFLFSMSHDIRTPMNAILGFTDIAEKYIDDKDRALEALGKVKVSGTHLLSLINDVLDMARVESGAVRLEEEALCIDTMRDNLFSIMSTGAEAKNISLMSTVSDSLEHHWIYADRLRLMRVLTNIVSNSVKYTNPGGKISVYTEELPCENTGYARFRYTVADTGIGMSEEYLAHVFEPFSRAETATKSGVTGTGLGMPITKALVELMGGTISIESKVGVGTMVVIEFENRIAEEVSPISAIPTDVTFDLEGKKILLVEDNELNREIATEILEEEGLLIDTAEDGDVAVEKMRTAKEGQYDLILMDIQMPRMNGYDATRAIRKLPSAYASGIPIIAMTANAFEEDKQNALAAGMNGHLAKPIDVPKLLTTLTEMLS